ncbi:MAG: hypothetical protein V3T19_05965 [Acidiferrobacterales bacterium]
MTENLARRFSCQALKGADVAVYLEGQIQFDKTPLIEYWDAEMGFLGESAPPAGCVGVP